MLSRGARELALVLFFVGLAVYATRPLAWDLQGQTLGGIDPPIYVWLVDWLARHLVEPSLLFEGNIFYPSRHAALYSDLALGSVLLVAPFTPWLSDPVPLYNLSVILTLAFGGWAFCALVRYLTGSTAAGILSGILAAFGSHQLLHIYQLGLINVGWLALFLLGLHLTLDRPDAKSVCLTGVAFALNALSCAYYGVAAAILALVFAAKEARRLRSWRVVASFGGAALLALLLMSPYLWTFWLLHSEEELARPLVASEDLAFKPHRDLTSAAYAYRSLLPRGGERLFPGIAVLTLAGLGIGRRCRSWSFFVLGALSLTLLSLGPSTRAFGVDLGAGYRALFAIPPLDVMMHPYSFAAVARFLLCILAGLGFASIGASRARPLGWSTFAPALAVLIGLIEVAGPGVWVRPVPAGVPPVYELLADLPAGAVLEVPLELREAMIWAARHRRPVVNGAGGVSPLSHGILERAIRRYWIRASRESGESLDIDATRPTAIVQALPVRYVIIPVGRSPELQSLKDAFDRSRSFVPVATASDGDVVYRVVRAERPRAPESP